jgi:hypothetical protein
VSEVKSGLFQAKQDNLCIYYAEVPISLPALEERLVVRVDTPAGLQHPESMLHDRRHLFGETLGIGVQKAIGTAACFMCKPDEVGLTISVDDYEKRKLVVVLQITMSNTEVQSITGRYALGIQSMHFAEKTQKMECFMP